MAILSNIFWLQQYLGPSPCVCSSVAPHFYYTPNLHGVEKTTYASFICMQKISGR
jgi:hypothetical protein